MISFRLLGACALAALALATAASAQTPADMQDLRDSLSLTPAQAEAWQAFQAASAPDPEQAARQRGAMAMMPTLHAPQRVDLSIAAMQADLQTLERRGAALKAFYAVLSPEQQRIFDQQTAQRDREQEP